MLHLVLTLLLTGTKERNESLQLNIRNRLWYTGDLVINYTLASFLINIISGTVKMFLLLWLVKLSNTSGDFLGGGGRQLKYLQFNSLVSSSFNNLTRKDKSRAEGKPHFR